VLSTLLISRGSFARSPSLRCYWFLRVARLRGLLYCCEETGGLFKHGVGHLLGELVSGLFHSLDTLIGRAERGLDQSMLPGVVRDLQLDARQHEISPRGIIGERL
jgi:hypothetical protein